jgi:hypothetical protein
MRDQAVASFQEFFAQFTIILDFSIENDSYRPVFVVHRLSAAIHVDDGQTPHAEPYMGIEMKPLVIGPPAANQCAHCTNQ